MVRAVRSSRLLRSRRNVQASGATGKTHDWRVSRRMAELFDRQVIPAGGLTPENVEDSTGRKSRDKVRKFLS